MESIRGEEEKRKELRRGVTVLSAESLDFLPFSLETCLTTGPISPNGVMIRLG